jgi:uncharacterized membrane protein YhaH (DUF805 family)
MSDISWGHLLFGFRGRINRAKWWLTVLVTIILSFVFIGIGMVTQSETIAGVLTFILWIIQLWIGVAAGAKRLHDLNRTAAWLVFFWGVPILLGIIFAAYAGVSVVTMIAAGKEVDPNEMVRIGGVALIIGVLVFAIAIWALIWFGCLRGTVGPNQYGPDPLEGREAFR